MRLWKSCSVYPPAANHGENTVNLFGHGYLSPSLISELRVQIGTCELVVDSSHTRRFPSAAVGVSASPMIPTDHDKQLNPRRCSTLEVSAAQSSVGAPDLLVSCVQVAALLPAAASLQAADIQVDAQGPLLASARALVASVPQAAVAQGPPLSSVRAPFAADLPLAGIQGPLSSSVGAPPDAGLQTVGAQGLLLTYGRVLVALIPQPVVIRGPPLSFVRAFVPSPAARVAAFPFVPRDLVVVSSPVFALPPPLLSLVAV
ncbi:hypothetical protein QBC38DRAFT_462272 [Podospora fimiseda]|uniref:Uncharacterized protein n=1 Tax=Podospora fimiseda TaxID=252190 RepID=A0AAN6YLS3_9PEZI|nr:hypothetical protein QBC38DRAFT_462272 [Podospora fimiseda]